MTSSRRRLAALVIAPLLVVGLSACAGAEPAAQPTPSPTPTPTVEAPPEAKPGSRVPLSCDELAAVPSEFTGVSVTAVDQSIDHVVAGFADCTLQVTVGGATALLDLTIVPELTDDRVVRLDVAAPYEPAVVGFAGPRSGAGCQEAYVPLQVVFCESVSFADQYTIVVNLNPMDASVDAELAISALASFHSALIAALNAAGDPLPAWSPGPGVLAFPRFCDSGAQSIVDALPFESGPHEDTRSGDGAPIYSVANERAGSSWCEWSATSTSPIGGYLTLEVVPGAAFAIDDGRFAPQGSEVAVSGADRAWLFVNEYGQHDVTFVVDDSIAIVRYSPDTRDPDPVASVYAVIDAIIATGPRT
jgi:hypothetical protein